MLRLKDNISLKELENFGFKYIENKSAKGDFSYCEKPIGGNVVLSISVLGIYSDTTIEENNITYIFSDCLDILFDSGGISRKSRGEIKHE